MLKMLPPAAVLVNTTAMLLDTSNERYTGINLFKISNFMVFRNE